MAASLEEMDAGTDTDNCEDINPTAATRAHVEPESTRSDLAAELQLREISPIKAKQGFISPINTLPVELLSHIFLIGALRDIEEFTPFPSSSIAASHVCRRWREISISTPSLWTHFRPRAHVEWTLRAQGLPQDFLVPPGRLRDCKNHEPNLRNMRSLRIHSPAVQYGRWGFDLSSCCMSLPAPNMKLLQLSGDDYGEGHGHHFSRVKFPSSPFRGQHNLKEVVISRCGFRAWDSLIFAGLRRLDLHGIPDSLHVDKLLSILTACPTLEELSIRECDIAL
ncbi:hypothetical protein BOTBODRAFT_358391 [Botryobasidium botryosum FD-172 SS1]|uniref:F-box domain-containing protein n=1 Tax=Botryobasidium botryosum (strain FD-172 SS1) TaxID=930990 RepID=A0A067MH47_BOTB1|nr:hypothetical protein BOTBODRAFT_358391 [Botryobasidium botryosum FD-172 SS1]